MANPQDIIPVRLDRTDVINIYNLLQRATYTGLDEAKVGVDLERRLMDSVAREDTPDEEDTDGSNIPSDDEPSSE